MDALGQGVAVEGEDERFLYANRALASMLGTTPEALVGASALDLIAPEDLDVVRRAQARRRGGESDAYEVRFARADGTLVPVLVTGVPRFEKGRVAGSIAVVTDLTETKRADAAHAVALADRTAEAERARHDAEQARREAEALAELSKLLVTGGDPAAVAGDLAGALVRAVPMDAVAVATVAGEAADLSVVWRSPEAAALGVGRAGRVPRGTGVVWSALAGREPAYLEDYREQAAAQEAPFAAAFGSVAFVPLADGSLGKPVVFVGGRLGGPRAWSARERSLLEAAGRTASVALERFRRQREAERAALTDALTGLGNRRAFDSDLAAELARAERHGHSVGVLVVDLDGLKLYNDREGHERGDALIREFGWALRSCLRREDRAYRVGGDEFGAVLTNTGEAAAVLERVRTAVRLTREAGFREADASAGAAAFPAEAATAADLVRLADRRMYARKQAKRGPPTP